MNACNVVCFFLSNYFITLYYFLAKKNSDTSISSSVVVLSTWPDHGSECPSPYLHTTLAFNEENLPSFPRDQHLAVAITSLLS